MHLNQKFSQTDLQVGEDIALLVGFATAHCALATSMIIGQVAELREKAICIDDRGRKLWLPRKALVKGKTDDLKTRHFELARWFRPDPQKARQMNRMTEHSVISA